MKPIAAMLSIVAALLPALAAGCDKQGKSARLQDAMKKLSPPSPQTMVAMAFDPNDPDRRREGVVLLSKRDWGRKEPYLKGYATLLKADEDASVRSAAARALGAAGAAGYLQGVANALDDVSASVRFDAAAALDSLLSVSGGSAPLDATDRLCKHATADSSADVRAACSRALRHCGQASAFRTLRQCLEDEDFSVRYQAHASLVQLTGRDLGYDQRNWPEDPDTLVQHKTQSGRHWWQWSWRPQAASKPGKDSSMSKPVASGALR